MAKTISSQSLPLLECWTSSISVISLCVSGWNLYVAVRSIGPGFYGGTALVIGFLLILQVLVLVFAVGIPVGIQYLRRALRLSRIAWLLILLASLGVALEFVSLSVIPITGRC